MLEISTARGSAVPVSELLRAARSLEPHPLHATPEEVVSYVSALKRADAEIAATIADGFESIPAEELDLLKRKRATIDAAVARQVTLAGRRLTTDREGSIATLNALFKLGGAPDMPLDGRHRGELVTLTMFPALDAFAKYLTRLWLPWLGKRFSAANSLGDNLLLPSTRFVGRAFWPRFSDYRRQPSGQYTAFFFKTYNGSGVNDPEVLTLKLDYSAPSNPAFLLRGVLDELVQLTGDYYLGKAYLSKPGGGYKLAAFFALRKWS